MHDARHTTIWRIAYISRRNVDDDAVAAIVRTSHERNKTAGITGVLLADDQNFLQVVEGDRASLSDLVLRLVTDQRHDQFKVMTSGTDDMCWFTNWSMRYVALSPAQRSLSKLVGKAPKLTMEQLFTCVMPVCTTELE